MKKYLGMLGLFIVTVIWGGGFAASDIALETLTPSQILAARFVLAAVLMCPLCAGKLKGITKAEGKAGFSMGLFLFGAFALQTIGLQYTTAAKNAFLTATNVVFVPFIALILYKKRISLQGVAGAFMAIAGAGVLSLNRDFSLGLGDGLTLACAICFAFQIFLTGEYVGRYRAGVLNFIQMVTAAVLSVACLLLSGGLEPVTVTLRGLYSVLYLGVVSTTLTYLLQTISQRYVDETRSAIILSLEAVFGALFSVLLLHERFTAKMIVGSILILGAVLVSELKFKRICPGKQSGQESRY